MSRIDRLPAIPLIASDPYLSIWMPADTMTQTDSIHWSGPIKPIRGTMTVDGAACRFLGTGREPEAGSRIDRASRQRDADRLDQRIQRRSAGNPLHHARPSG